MTHTRHYSLEEALAALPVVTGLLERMRRARERLTDSEAREALAEAAPSNGGGAPGRDVSEGFLELQRVAGRTCASSTWCSATSSAGSWTSPRTAAGREVYLCWEEGEDEIAYWHEPDAGFSGRRPLDDG